MTPLLTFLMLAGVFFFGADQHDLLAAIRNGDHATARKLLAAGTDANSADAEGTTALMHAVIESDVQMIMLLIEKGAVVNARNAQDSTALMYAATNLAKTRLLLERGADFKVRN
jgi:ankyrin repeat protein